jgi:hypothetical protein
MQAQPMPGAAKPLMIIVPRAQPHLYTSLHRAFDHDATVEVTVDRRFTERHGAASGVRRHRVDRRRRPGSHSDLTAGRWIVVARAPRPVDVLDARVRAILFLCCSHHVVPCQQCQNTYRLGWVQRLDPAGFACPLCGNDLSETVRAHAQGCRNFV